MMVKSTARWMVIGMVLASAGCAAEGQYAAMTLERDGAPAVAELNTTASAAPAAATAAPPVMEKANAPLAAAQRIVIYSGLIQLVVADVAQTLEAVRAQAIGMGGYLQEMDSA